MAGRPESTEMFLRELYSEAVDAAHPGNLVRGALTVKDGIMEVAGQAYSLFGGVTLVGFGKAVLPLAAEIERILGADWITRGIVSVPVGSGDVFGQLLKTDSRKDSLSRLLEWD
jgi:glycerate-2-kinase